MLALLLVLGLIVQAKAESSAEQATSVPMTLAPPVTEPVETGESSRAPGRESWYWYSAFSAQVNRYPSALQGEVDFVTGISGVARTPLALDLAGVYWPASYKSGMLVGGVLTYALDRFSKGGIYTEIDQITLAGSLMHFTGGQPGDGFFFRADLGLCKASFSGSGTSTETTDLGYSAYVGAGYGWPLGLEARMLLSGGLTGKRIESAYYWALGAGLGFLL